MGAHCWEWEAREMGMKGTKLSLGGGDEQR